MFVQNVLVAVFVGAAVLYLLRGLWRGIASGGRDEGCASCGCGGSRGRRSDRLGERKELITLETPDGREDE